MNGISPKKNRTIPPLRYDDVIIIKEKFPELLFYLNGGINDIKQITNLSKDFDGFMIGRKIYDDPMFLQSIENNFFNKNYLTRHELVKKYLDKINLSKKIKHHSLRHLVNLYKNTIYSKKWKILLHNVINNDISEKELILFNIGNKNEKNQAYG